jgi:threonine synthase
LGISNLLVKDESKNPFGTFKDRRNSLAIDKAIEQKVNKVVLITSGNAGYSLARLAEGTGIKVVCVIDSNLNSDIKKSLGKYSYKLVELDLTQRILHTRDVQRLARETSDEEVLDVTNHYDAAFQSIVAEIKDENPDYLVTPLGGGEAFVGLYNGLKKYRLKTTLVGAGVHRLQDHELRLRAYPSIADMLYTPFTPYRKKIISILKEGHIYFHISEKLIKSTYVKVRHFCCCETSSAAAFASLLKINAKEKSKIIVVNSGKGTWRNNISEPDSPRLS